MKTKQYTLHVSILISPICLHGKAPSYLVYIFNLRYPAHILHIQQPQRNMPLTITAV